MTAIVLGYYDRKNLGDDLFQYILSSHLTYKVTNYKLIFINPDDVDELPNADVILVGGGDLVNDYFMNNIRKLTKDCQCPIYGIGLGFPYPQLVTREYLDIFDFIHTRTNVVLPKLIEIMPNRVVGGVDLVRFIPDNIDTQYNLKLKPVGVFLSNSVCGPKDPLIDKIAEVIKYVTDKKIYHVYIYSMNTSGTIEDDDQINAAVYKKLIKLNCKNVSLVNKSITPETAVGLFKQLYASICTRFHAHVLSIIANTPLISLYSTFKVQDLLNQEGLQMYSEMMTVDPVTLMPVDMDVNRTMAIFDKMVENYSLIKNKMRVSQEEVLKDESVKLIKNLLYYKPITSDKNIDVVIKRIGKYLSKKLKSIDLSKADISQVGVFKNVEAEDAHYIAQIITYCLYKTDNKPFTWGLANNLGKPDFDLKDAIRWIMQNFQNKMPYLYSKVSLSKRIYNLTYFDQDLLDGIHRSGWQYVVNTLKMSHNPNGIVFDSYLDKTFGWKREFYEQVGILPIRRQWIGVFHHTPVKNYDKNNLADLISQPSFIKSLKYCKGIIVLSSYLKKWLDDNLPQDIQQQIRVSVLYHPSEIPELKWSPEAWQHNMDKKLIQIGAWLRDTFAIIALPNPKNIRKCALKGINMDNYYPPSDFLFKLQTALVNICGQDDKTNKDSHDICICRDNTNKFVAGMYEWMNDNINGIQIINNVNNIIYDKLLSENIVFIKLIDASACNTIIECILRNTPILVNRLPAVIEYIGVDYPLYYNTYEEAVELINNNEKILEAHRYLSLKDKTYLNIETFINGLNEL